MGKFAININISGESYLTDLKDMNKFDFEEYNYLLDVLNNKELNILEQYKQLLFLFTDLDELVINNVKNIGEINFPQILQQEIMNPIINLKWKAYLLNNGLKKQNLDKISIGKFSDFEYFLTNQDYDKKIQMSCALMFCGNDYNMIKLEKIVNDIEKTLSIGNSLIYYEEFLNFRKLIYKNYNDLFKIESEDNKDDNIDEDDVEIPIENAVEYERKLEEEEKKNETEKKKVSGDDLGLISLVYMLANDNYLNIEKILEKPLFSILNYCRWRKQQNEIHEKQNRIKS